MDDRVVVIGGGPAGLTACYELAKAGLRATVLERESILGGISRTDEYKGYRFDIGGHRFFTKCKEVDELWTEMLGSEMLDRPRMSRVFYRGRFFQYPLRPVDALRNLGLCTAVACVASYCRWRLLPYRDESTFEQWVTNRFGKRLYGIFFKTYTEKVWGVPCSEISADWAAQRIKGLSLLDAIKNAVGGGKGGAAITTLIDRFRYPRLGPGQMWERAADLSRGAGQEVVLQRCVGRVVHERGRVRALAASVPGGDTVEVEGSHFISSMALRDLVEGMDPPAPDPVVEAARRLRYRDFVTVGLIVAKADVFPDNWIYIHSPEVRMGRIQNFKNWSPSMVPDRSMTCLGLEYFVHEGDDLWSASDASLIDLGARECSELGFVKPDEVVDGVVVRIPKAYPVYDRGYQDRLGVIREWLAGLGNLQCVGRNGQHRYNNSDHSMLTAMLAVRNLLGESHDIWSVNTEQEYHEERRAPSTT